MDEGTVVGVNRGRPQVRKRARGSWSARKEDEFLIALSISCNVTSSSRSVGMSTKAAYYHRAKDAAFRNAWAVALREGYERLETVLLDRAINGRRKPVFQQGKQVGSVREYPDRLAMLLYHHHTRSDAGAVSTMTPDDIEEARAKLMKRLNVMRARNASAAKRLGSATGGGPADALPPVSGTEADA